MDEPNWTALPSLSPLPEDSEKHGMPKRIRVFRILGEG